MKKIIFIFLIFFLLLVACTEEATSSSDDSNILNISSEAKTDNFTDKTNSSNSNVESGIIGNEYTNSNEINDNKDFSSSQFNDVGNNTGNQSSSSVSSSTDAKQEDITDVTESEETKTDNEFADEIIVGDDDFTPVV